MRIRLFDKEFAHPGCCCGYDAPAAVEWDRNAPNGELPVSVFTERCLELVEPGKAINVAWLLEPEAIHAYGYNTIRNGWHAKFDHILTFDRDMLERWPEKAHFWTPGGSWIWRRDWAICPKTKNVSIVAGMKDWTTGHRLRHEVIRRLEDRFDLVCGYGRKPVEPRAAIFQDYRYSVVIENSRVDYYWTEKLIDPILCGCIPIFWGCPSIEQFGFDMNGILMWETVDELAAILDHVGPDDYEARRPAIEKNFKQAQKYAIVEDFMYESFLKGFDHGA